ncbi:MAG TPA: aldehyde dehydrogenase family protein, partial [Candidatus Latescibacteria bacterium]|nr:aldehyde dehydrogenase family protein [Candidatus Latescibacterota bacterium]
QIVPATSSGKRHWVLKHPDGVCATIAPWNFPVLLQARKVAAALAAGCTVVSRPATGTPLATMEMFRCLEEAGLPPGVANLVTGPAEEVADAFFRSPICRKLSFTGSTEVGRELMRLGADGLKKLSLELGGSAPVVVFPDVDVDEVARLCVTAKFRNAGQVCIAPTRFYVHEEIRKEFTERCVALAEELRVGNGLDPEVDMGPLFDEGAVRKMEAFVEDAIAKGAKVLCGGGAPKGEAYAKGFWFTPTVLTDVHRGMRLSCEEVFGPILPVFGFRTTEEAIASANDTSYGLAAYVLTRGLNTAIRMAEALEFGIVGINDMVPATAQCPFGGMKESGTGREGAHEGLEEYMESKYVSIAL